MFGSIFNFIIPVQKYGACPPKNLGPKNMLNLARFHTPFHFKCEYLWNGYRRVLKLPPDTHNSLIPLLLNTLPFYDDICKRSARFIISCLQCNVSLVRFVARFGVFVNRCTSPLGRNIQYCCSNFGWNFQKFVNGDISMSNNVFVKSFYSSVSESDWLTVDALCQALNLRDGFDFLFFFNGSTLLDSELDSLILYLASSHTL